ncbi:MAG: TonB-dependent receptor [Parvularculaceae bacterium]
MSKFFGKAGMTTKLKTFLLVATSLCAPATAFAQSDEIIVSARKKAENIQDVPISVSVLDGEKLAEMNVRNLDQIGGLIPNVVTAGGGQGDTTFSIRGLSTTSNNPGFEGGIGLYIDEVYIGKQYAFVTPLLDVGRLEVLRGPQGTLFGRNTIGGVINMVTANPSDEFEASARAIIGNYDYVSGAFRISGPVADTGIKASVSGQVIKRDGYLKDFARDADYNNEDSINFRFKAIAPIGERIQATVALDYYEDKNVEGISDIRSGALEPLDPYPLTDRMIGTDYAASGRRDAVGGYVRFDADMGFADLVSISALRRHRIKGILDQDFSVADISYTGRKQDQHQISQELRLQSKADSPISYLAGFYYYAEEIDAMTIANLGVDVLGSPETAYTIANIDADTYAFFGAAEMAITDMLTIGGGIRYTHESKELALDQVLSPGAFLVQFLGIAIPISDFSDDVSEGAVSGNAYINLKPTDNIMAYASYSRGYKAGGFNATIIGTTPSDLAFDAEFVNSYEVGFKTSWADNRLRFNAAAFYIDYTDKQEQSNVATFFIVDNAAAAEVKGFEVELFAEPAEDFTITAGAGYTDATYDKYPACSIDGSFNPVSCSGNRLQNAPKWTASVAARYAHPLTASTKGFIGGDLSYRGDAFVNVTNDPGYLHEARTLVNGRLGIEASDGSWSASIWAKNIFDEEAQEFSFDFLGTDYAYLNPPRTFGGEVSVKF